MLVSPDMLKMRIRPKIERNAGVNGHAQNANRRPKRTCHSGMDTRVTQKRPFLRYASDCSHASNTNMRDFALPACPLRRRSSNLRRRFFPGVASHPTCVAGPYFCPGPATETGHTAHITSQVPHLNGDLRHFVARPATFWYQTCSIWVAGPATFCSQTCNILVPDLRHFVVRPAAFGWPDLRHFGAGPAAFGWPDLRHFGAGPVSQEGRVNRSRGDPSGKGCAYRPRRWDSRPSSPPGRRGRATPRGRS